MSDRRVVQCFGVWKRPHKKPQECRMRYVWSAVGATRYNFGRTGTSCCPRCGTPPDFSHPFNQYLGGEITLEEATELMQSWRPAGDS